MRSGSLRFGRDSFVVHEMKEMGLPCSRMMSVHRQIRWLTTIGIEWCLWMRAPKIFWQR